MYISQQSSKYIAKIKVPVIYYSVNHLIIGEL